MIDGATSRGEDLPLLNDPSWLPWLAGLIDGAGTIAVVRQWGFEGWTYTPVLIVLSPHLALLERAQIVSGEGRIRPDHGRDGVPILAWEARAAHAARVLAAIRPYLLAQAGRADAAIRVQWFNAYYARGARPADVEARLEALYEFARPAPSRNLRRLTIEQVREIRALKGALSQREIAARFGVSVNTVRNILAGRDTRGLDDDGGDSAPTR
jgi:hypothetical protein